MAVTTYTNTGNKSNSRASLDKAVFGLDVSNTQLLKQTYEAGRSNSRTNVAHTKTRGEVRGGGRKPWRQKGTGRARFGSIRNPIWRGGGIAFGPRTRANYNKQTGSAARKQSLRQSLSLAKDSGRISVIEALPTVKKTAELVKILDKIGFNRGLIVAEKYDNPLKRFVANIEGVKFTSADKLSAGDVLDSAELMMEKPAVKVITERLKG